MLNHTVLIGKCFCANRIVPAGKVSDSSCKLIIDPNANPFDKTNLSTIVATGIASSGQSSDFAYVYKINVNVQKHYQTTLQIISEIYTNAFVRVGETFCNGRFKISVTTLTIAYFTLTNSKKLLNLARLISEQQHLHGLIDLRNCPSLFFERPKSSATCIQKCEA